MKKRTVIFITVLCGFLLCSCGQASPSTENKAVVGSSESGKTFPFKDDEGRTRYRLVVNGKEVETANYPFTYADKPNGGYYPLQDVLTYLGVESLCSEDKTVLTTKINNKTLRVTAGVKKMTYGSKSIQSETETPVLLNGCLYVPSFLFMSVFNAVVDFNSDRTSATLENKTAIDLAISGTKGLSVPSGSGVSSSSSGSSGGSGTGSSSGVSICTVCNGSGHNICTSCAGTGRKTEYQQVYDPISKQMKTTQKSVICPNCSGRGYITCSVCGGSGHK